MSMGVFMPPPAPLMTGGGGGGLDGMITVGSFDFGGGFIYYGWSDGSGPPAFGTLSGLAAPNFTFLFAWLPASGAGSAILDQEYPGASLIFQGETYAIIADPGGQVGTWGFNFGPEVATWPTSGTHPFTLTLP